MADDFPEKYHFLYIAIDLSSALNVPWHSHASAVALNVVLQKKGEKWKLRNRYHIFNTFLHIKQM